MIYFYLGLYYKDFGSKRKKDIFTIVFLYFDLRPILFHEKSSTQDFIIKILVATKEKKDMFTIGFLYLD